MGLFNRIIVTVRAKVNVGFCDCWPQWSLVAITTTVYALLLWTIPSTSFLNWFSFFICLAKWITPLPMMFHETKCLCSTKPAAWWRLIWGVKTNRLKMLGLHSDSKIPKMIYEHSVWKTDSILLITSKTRILTFCCRGFCDNAAGDKHDNGEQLWQKEWSNEL